MSWRCLGRTCRASIRSDALMTTVNVTNSKHTGSHPVTLRRLSLLAPVSPAQSPARLPSLVTPLNTPSPPTTPCSLDTDNSDTTIPTTISTASTTATPPPSTLVSTSTPLQSTSSATQKLITENHQLKEEIVRLTSEMRCILDHSIENDARLLQYTTEVFAPPRSKPSSMDPAPLTTTNDSSTQCDMLPLTDVQPTRPKTSPSVSTNYELSEHTIESMKTTIEVLEAEVGMLRQQVKTCQCSSATESWTVVSNKRSTLIPTGNRFSTLRTKKSKPPTEYHLTKQNNNAVEPRKFNYHLPSKSFPFQSVEIRGDSHVRNIAGMTAQLLCQRVAVTGICKPGANLRQVVNPRPQPPVMGTRCDVLIAGTNDLAAGEQRNIYSNLERSIRTWPPDSRLVIATVPHRHDLPATHNINQETALVNAYIEELATRHHIPVIDFNQIQRRYFTGHGMHLRKAGKWRLAKLLVDALHKLNPMSVAPNPPRTTSTGPALTERIVERIANMRPQPRRPEAVQTPPPAAQPAQPHALPYDTFADAVKSSSKHHETGPQIERSQNFLGTSISRVEQN